jgi:hypothetical protein
VCVCEVGWGWWWWACLSALMCVCIFVFVRACACSGVGDAAACCSRTLCFDHPAAVAVACMFAVTKAHIQLLELLEGIEKGRLKPDGKVLKPTGHAYITKVSAELPGAPGPLHAKVFHQLVPVLCGDRRPWSPCGTCRVSRSASVARSPPFGSACSTRPTAWYGGLAAQASLVRVHASVVSCTCM